MAKINPWQLILDSAVSTYDRIRNAEIANPAINILDYQEDVGQGSDSLLEYSDRGDAGQNSGFVPKKNDGQEWKPMSQQGERPQNDADFYKDPYASTGLLVPEGEQESRPKDQGAGYTQQKEVNPNSGTPKGDLDVDTQGAGLPPVEDYGSEIPYNQAIYLASEEKTMNWGEKLKQLNARMNPETFDTNTVDSMFKDLDKNSKVASLVDEAISRGAGSENNRIVLSSLDDLFSFNRVANDTLIHKSSEDLWKIGMDSSGQTYIEQLYTDNGKPLKG